MLLAHSILAKTTDCTLSSPSGERNVRSVVPRDSITQLPQGSPKCQTLFFWERRHVTINNLMFASGTKPVILFDKHAWYHYTWSKKQCFWIQLRDAIPAAVLISNGLLSPPSPLLRAYDSQSSMSKAATFNPAPKRRQRLSIALPQHTSAPSHTWHAVAQWHTHTHTCKTEPGSFKVGGHQALFMILLQIYHIYIYYIFIYPFLVWHMPIPM